MIRIDNEDALVPLYTAICESDPITSIASDQSARFTRFKVGTSTVVLAVPQHNSESGTGAFLSKSLASRGPGLHLVGVLTEELQNTSNSLLNANARLLSHHDQVFVHPGSANGVLVQLIPGHETNEQTDAGNTHLDHVAVAVRDLATASVNWELICASPPFHMGVHPASNGSFEATRFVLDGQMIELISPVKEESSVVANRLRTHGEGAQTVALVARNLDATLARLRELEARLIWQDPHWFVHPGDTGGVLIQITPRIEHAS